MYRTVLLVSLFFLFACSAPSKKEGILEVVSGSKSDFAFCFETEITKRPTTEGKVAVTSAIHKQGRANSTTLKVVDGKLSSELLGCIKSTFNRLSFPKEYWGTTYTITLPFYRVKS